MSHRSGVLRGSLLGVKVIAAAVSLVVLVGSGWAWATYRSFTGNIQRITFSEPANQKPRKDIDGRAQNILIVGNDDRTGISQKELDELGTTEDGGGLNTDTMMLMHIPADGRKASIISFPRDTYVDIPGHPKAKLNSAYTTGIADGHGDKSAGASLLRATVENLTGLSIDHFVQVGLLGFYNISNAVGGVDLCLNEDARPAKSPQEVLDDVPGVDGGFENGTFISSYTHINLHKGLNKNVEGPQALAFVRQRHGLPGGDLDRIKRQQVFLSAVFRKLYSKGVITNPFKIQSFLKAVSGSLTMDDALAQDPLQLVDQMQSLTAGNLTFAPIPLLPQRPTIDGVGSVLLPDTAAMPTFIQTLLGNPLPDPYKYAKAAMPSKVTVSLANNSNSNGLETTNAAALRTLGFTVTVPPATAEVQDKTTISYPPGSEAAAKAVANAVPGAVLVPTKTVTGVVLALGNNGVQVKSLMHPPAGVSASPTPSSTTVITASDTNCVN